MSRDHDIEESRDFVGEVVSSHHSAKFGIHRPCRTRNNDVSNIRSNSSSNSNAEVYKWPIEMLTTIKEIIVSLIRKIKTDHYNNLDYKKIMYNKSFWKHVKPLFTKKNARSNKITLVEDNSILENNDKIAETFNNFFTSAVSNLNIPPFVDPSVEIDHIEDPILRIIEQYKNHPSIVALTEKKLNKQFSFEYIPKSDVKKEILILDVSKASQDSDIPTKIVKVNADIFAEVLYKAFNRSLEVGEFPSGMKLGM